MPHVAKAEKGLCRRVDLRGLHPHLILVSGFGGGGGGWLVAYII